MSGKAIFSIIMIVFWSIMAAWSVSRVLDAQKNVRIAEQDVEDAKAEYEEAERGVDNVLKYNCAKPVFSDSGILCPNG